MNELENIQQIAGQLQWPGFYGDEQLPEGVSTPMLTLPPGWNQVSLEKHLPAPLRIEEQAKLSNVESLVAYLGEFEATPRVFANESSKEVLAVLDPTQDGEPSHQSHTAVLALEFAPEWKIWKRFCGSYVSRKEFVRFVENNLDEITGDFSGAKILEMCRDLKAKRTGEIDVSEDLEHGDRRLTISNAQHVSSGSGDNQVTFPEHIEVELRVFKGEAKFRFQARLRWELSQGNELSFAIDLRDSEIVEEQAFNDIVSEVENTLDLSVLSGQL